MMSHCANPACGKPLHYLRDGNIFRFEVAGNDTEPEGKRLRRLEHFWLCGECSERMMVVETSQGIRAVAKPAIHGFVASARSGAAAS